MCRYYRFLLATLLCASLHGCGSIMAGAGAGPIEEDLSERTFAQQLEDESIEDQSQGQYQCCLSRVTKRHTSVLSPSTALF